MTTPNPPVQPDKTRHHPVVLEEQAQRAADLQLKTNTGLTREIDRLTTELHSRLLDKPARQPS